MGRGNDTQTIAQEQASFTPSVPPGNLDFGNMRRSGTQFSGIDADTLRSNEVPMRPPGVWRKPVRASSCSSGASTRASSNDKVESLKTAAKKECSSRCSKQLQIEIPTGSSFCVAGKRVCWPVDARKLRSCDMQIVSPAFELSPGSEFKLLIKSAASGGKRGRAGFKAGRGRGIVELKCISGSSTDLPALTFRISLNDQDDNPHGRGLITHDFQRETIYQESQAWDFDAAVDVASQMFVVCLEVAPLE